LEQTAQALGGSFSYGSCDAGATPITLQNLAPRRSVDETGVRVFKAAKRVRRTGSNRTNELCIDAEHRKESPGRDCGISIRSPIPKGHETLHL